MDTDSYLQAGSSGLNGVPMLPYSRHRITWYPVQDALFVMCQQTSAQAGTRYQYIPVTRN